MGLIIIIGLLFWGWAEMSAFIFIGNKIGGLSTLLGVFLTAFFGVALLKNQGLSALKRVRSDVAKGNTPVTSIADSISLVFGGGLMLIPGYVTDILGLLLFIPGFRTICGIYLLNWIGNSQRFNGFVNVCGSSFTEGNRQNSGIDGRQNDFNFAEHRYQKDYSEDIIEGEFEERPDFKSQLHQKKKSGHPVE